MAARHRAPALAWVCALGAIVLLRVSPPCALAASPTGCAHDTIGLDTSYARGATGALLGKARGQSFFARDTLMEFLRVWRVAWEDSAWGIGLHPYIVETDSLGVPDVRRVVWEGQTIVIPEGDGVNPIEFKWTFDPPLALPHAGLYVFFLFQDPCAAYFDILGTNEPEHYAEGIFWSTDRSNCRLYDQIGLNHNLPDRLLPRGPDAFATAHLGPAEATLSVSRCAVQYRTLRLTPPPAP